MNTNQRRYTDKILFDYYMISSVRENEIHSPFSFHLDRSVFSNMTYCAEVLNKLVNRITRSFIQAPESIPVNIDDFPNRDLIFSNKNNLPSLFWVRFDAFERQDGGIFFCEFNYDKPCAQREIAVSQEFSPLSASDAVFVERFRNSFQRHVETFWGEKDRISVGILVDPSHYEEVHLAHLYIDILKPLGYDFVIVGGDNLEVQGQRVAAFGMELDVILRQYPTEFLYEFGASKGILELYNDKKVLILNDPRAILGQSKSLFALLWDLVDSDSGFLTGEEADIIKATVPRTRVFHKGMRDELLQNRKKYVLKASFGRYSEEVYIGKMHTAEEWEETVRYVSESDKLHIVQDFCPIKKEKVLRFNGYCYEEAEAFGNFGIYMIDGSFAGTCVRWSRDYLSVEDLVWITPVGVKDRSLCIIKPVAAGVDGLWREINDKAAFEHGYTGGYTGMQQSFSCQAISLDRQTFTELESATKEITDIIKKTVGFVKENHSTICPVLGISDRLSELVIQDLTDSFTFIGRYDWVMDSGGRLKLLEFNSETPAGLMESIFLSDMLQKHLGIRGVNPNAKMKESIRSCFSGILRDYGKVRDIKNVGLVTSCYYEDWYNTTVVHDCIKDLDYNFIIGEVSGLSAVDGKLYLYDTPLDAVYRYYPLDWFDSDPYYEGVLEALREGTFSINPPSTLISQSKAFMALIWELAEKGFYSASEQENIEKYVPRTALSPKKLKRKHFCIKPCFGREGQEVAFNFKEPLITKDLRDCIYQEWVDIEKLTLDIYTAMGIKKEVTYPVIGAYVADDRFCGIYTRAGGQITDKWAVYIPTYIKLD